MKVLSITVSLALAMLPVTAHAQPDREKVTLDASATLAVAPPTLAVRALSDLSFGLIALPPKPVVQCRYEVNIADKRALADGTVAPAGTCAFLDTAQGAGIVEITCADAQPMAFSYTVSSPLADRDIAFAVDQKQIGFQSSDGVSATAICDRGRKNFLYGGTVVIGNKAVADTAALTVGRIALEVFYDNAACGKCQ